MKNLSKSFLCITLLFAAAGIKAGCDTSCNDSCDTACDTSCSDCVSIFMPRSPGDNLVRQFQHNGYEFGNDCFYGEFSAEYRYQRSFRGDRIAKSLFGSDCLSFVGSGVTTRNNAKDLLADNFGLSPLTDVKLGFSPRIQNHIVDFQLYIGLSECWEGLYMQFNAPLAHSKWALRPGSCTASSDCGDSNDNCDTSKDCGDCNDDCAANVPALNNTTAGFAAGCMDAVSAGTIAPAQSFGSALGGDFLFGDMQTKWNAGRFNFNCCDQDDTKLADFYFNLGYNFYECPDYSFGAYIRVVAPTGTDMGECCTAKNVFYPVIGQDHWRLGAGMTAHAELWNCDNEQFLNVYLEGYLVHLFDRCQVRSFDFKDKGCMSRYMLLKEFDADGVYNGNLINAINYSTRHVNVDVDVQGEFAIEFVYSNDCGFSAGLGYNLYGRSEDNICGVGSACDASIAGRNFGIKGCAPVQACGFSTAGGLIVANVLDETLNSTQSAATARSCGAVDNAQTLYNAADPGYIYLDSCKVDCATIVAGDAVAGLVASAAQQSSSTAITVTATTGVIAGNTAAPVYITTADLDLKSGAVESQISNKIFGHLDYEWSDCDWTPYLRAGAEVEFASCSKPGTMNAWGIFVGGGVSF
jgi:hypothetical protein